jgi:phospholipase/carboxylesterase
MLTRDATAAILQRPRLKHAGAPLTRAAAVLVLVHGRGADASGILPLGEALALPEIALLAPEAEGRSWYPHTFLAPLAANEPHLSRGLSDLDALGEALRAAGVPDEKLAWLGFSQGACLMLEHTARRPRRSGAVIALAGGLIGPPGTPRAYPGSLAGTPVFLGCGNVDTHIPEARVRETDAVLRGMGADVTLAV